jgi:hypothetical protein
MKTYFNVVWIANKSDLLDETTLREKLRTDLVCITEACEKMGTINFKSPRLFAFSAKMGCEFADGLEFLAFLRMLVEAIGRTGDSEPEQITQSLTQFSNRTMELPRQGGCGC